MSKIQISQSAYTTLEVLLYPGGKARLSPFVEAAQLYVLTGEWIDETRRHESTNRIISKNEKLLEELARLYCLHKGEFNQENYENQKYLKMYLAYYFPVNVAKIQTVLLDLLRTGNLNNQNNLVDIGVGTGVTAIAVLDFLLALGHACLLHKEPIPINNISLTGFDRSTVCIEMSKKVLESYIQALENRKHLYPNNNNNKTAKWLDQIKHWGESASWRTEEILTTNNLPESTNFIILSNIFNEILAENKTYALEHTLESLGNKSTILIIEPGDKESSKKLMKWRCTFLKNHKRFFSNLPCGQDISQNSNCNCWIARRESIYQYPLYERIREEIKQYSGSDKRSFDKHENKLLSWSYAVLCSCNENHFKDNNKKLKYTPGESIKDIELCYLSEYTKKNNKYKIGKPKENSERYKISNRFDQLIKFCPNKFEYPLGYLKKPAGFELPPLKFGQKFRVKNFNLTMMDEKTFLINPLPKSYKTQVEPIDDWAGILEEKDNHGFLKIYTEETQNVLDELSYRLFGFTNLFSYQHKILKRVLTGQNILGIAATGGGKSECFILPALILPGVTIVISPLKSLMEDQYSQRLSKRYGFADLATIINGDVPLTEKQSRLHRMEMGYYKLVYFTPEQLERSYILESLKRTNETVGVRYLAVDEAHCISQWGHDFRPSYLNILRRFRDYKLNPTIIALTATASPRVRDDICVELDLNPDPIEDSGDVLVESSNRPEIDLVVRVMHSSDEKMENIVDELKELQKENKNNQDPGAALVFMPLTGGNPNTKKNYQQDKKQSSNRGKYSAGVTYFAEYLKREHNLPLAIYHSKMENEGEATINDKADNDDNSQNGSTVLGKRYRQEEQEKFINSQATGINLMVATKGFGMGIDKSNIRLVIHRTPPGSMEAYAQEFGRAGRDGEPSKAIVYYSPDVPEDESNKSAYAHSDYEIQKYFLENKYIRRKDIENVAKFLFEKRHPLTITPGVQGKKTFYYFTFDEVKEFLDSSDFIWPEFPPREPERRETDDHKAILDRGYFYKKKKKYIERILTALVEFRPEINGHKNSAFLESCHKTGVTLFKYEDHNWSEIYNSNHYFGEVIRSSNINQSQFVQYLRSENLIPLAKHLNLSLTELSQMLNDIKYSDGRETKYKKWISNLMNFWFVTAPLWGPARGKNSFLDWINYAGAYTRRKQDHFHIAQNRLSKKYAYITDWFGWRETPPKTGWEFLPGNAFNEKVFSDFIDAFMQLHDERRRQDESSYYRFLTNYIGVNDDGSLPEGGIRTNCLRAELLGYLASGEIIKGDKCFGCSNCVPKENFVDYSIEKKMSVVEKLSSLLFDLLEHFSEQSTQIPAKTDVEKFFKYLVEDHDEGLSVIEYFTGRTNRLLDETPNHQTALWLRLYAMIEDIIPLQPKEIINSIESLLYQVDEKEKSRLFKLIAKLEDMLTGDFENQSSFRLMLLSYHQKQNEIHKAISYGEKLIASGPESPISMQTRERLLEVYSPTSTYHDLRKYLNYTQALARYKIINEDPKEAIRFYNKFFNTEPGKEFVFNECRWISVYDNQGEILTSILIHLIDDNKSDNFVSLICDIVEQENYYKNWSNSNFNKLVDKLPKAILQDCRKIYKHHITTSLLPLMPNIEDQENRRKLMLDVLGHLDWDDIQKEIEKYITLENGKELIVDILSAWQQVNPHFEHSGIEECKNKSLQKNLDYLLNKITEYLNQDNYQKSMSLYQLTVYRLNLGQLETEVEKIANFSINKTKKKLLITYIIKEFLTIKKPNNEAVNDIIQKIIELEPKLTTIMGLEIIKDVSIIEPARKIILPYLESISKRGTSTYKELNEIIEILKILGEPDLEQDLHNNIITLYGESDEINLLEHYVELSKLEDKNTSGNRSKCLFYCMKALENAQINDISKIFEPYFSYFAKISWEELVEDTNTLIDNLYEFQIPLIFNEWLQYNPDPQNHKKLCKFILSTGMSILEQSNWFELLSKINSSLLLGNPSLLQSLIGKLDNPQRLFGPNFELMDRMRLTFLSRGKNEGFQESYDKSWKIICKIRPSEIVWGLNLAIELINTKNVDAYIDLLIEQNDFSNIKKINYDLFHVTEASLSKRSNKIFTFFEKLLLLYQISKIHETKWLELSHLNKIIEIFNPKQSREMAIIASLLLENLPQKTKINFIKRKSMEAETLIYAGRYGKAMDIISQYKLTEVFKVYKSEFDLHKNEHLPTSDFSTEMEHIIKGITSTWKVNQ